MTQLQAASPAPDRDLAAEAVTRYPHASGPLVCDPHEIFDTSKIRAQIADLATDRDNTALRSEVVSLLRDANKLDAR